MTDDQRLCFDYIRASKQTSALIQLIKHLRYVWMMTFGVSVSLLVGTSFGQTVTPASALTSQAREALGSPDFKPAPDRPVGWRGDWTGRFPGASPPIEWSRRAKGITSEIKYQAGKPS